MNKQQTQSIISSSKFFSLLTSLFVLFFAWMYLSKIDITFQAPGSVMPESNFTMIDTMVDGQIVKVNFKQGDIVDEGDTVVVIDPGVGYEKYNVISNVKGRIQTLHYRNPGAVVKKGEPILTIVPEDQKMIIVGKLSVSDRGYVQIGQKAKVKLANQDQVRFGPINGQVINISPDVIYSQTGTYYEIEIELEEQKFTSSTMEYTLVPGINVIVFILAGERNVLSYITSPFYNNVGEALQEK
ncbi:MAG: hypothetical protein CMM91_09820 [Rickettsiales bacterium]|nr:hypothetical protein [Rickettsiales bacterium]MAI85209.1 hypothetical protein [Rickettsiales bacterium]